MFSLPPLVRCPWPIPPLKLMTFICSRNDRRQAPLGFTRLCWDFHTIRHVNMKQQLGWRELIKIATSYCKQAAMEKREIEYLTFFFSPWVQSCVSWNIYLFGKSKASLFSIEVLSGRTWRGADCSCSSRLRTRGHLVPLIVNPEVTWPDGGAPWLVEFNVGNWVFQVAVCCCRDFLPLPYLSIH